MKRCWCNRANRWAFSARTPKRRACCWPTPTWWATGPTGDEFHRLEQLGLTMYGQMTAGSWIYIGSQGILQGTFETFAAAADKHFQRIAAGKLDRLRRHGRDERRAAAGRHHERRLFSRHRRGPGAHREAPRDRLLRPHGARIWMKRCAMIEEARERGQAISVGLVGNCADVIPELARRGVVPDILTDQTSAHDPLQRLRPQWNDAGRSARAARVESRRIHSSGPSQAMGAARRGHAGAETNGRRDVRLRQQHPHPGQARRRRECLRYSRLRARVYSPAVLRRTRSVSLGGALGIARRHPRDRSTGAGTLPGQRRAQALAGPGARAHPVSRTAGAHLLAGLRRASRIRPRASTTMCGAERSKRRS